MAKFWTEERMKELYNMRNSGSTLQEVRDVFQRAHGKKISNGRVSQIYWGYHEKYGPKQTELPFEQSGNVPEPSGG